MKKLIYAFAALGLVLAGCNKADRVFDESATVRVQKAVDEVDNILLNNPDGWVLQYFPQTDKLGGYNIHVKFNANMAAQMELLETVAGMPAQSYNSEGLYQVKPEQSVMLSFDTRNNALHGFMDLSGTLKLKGDYEFLPQEWSAESVTLRGKRYGYWAYLAKLEAGQTADDYKAELEQSKTDFEQIAYKVSAGGKSFGMMPIYDMRHLILHSNGAQQQRIPYVYTVDGVKLYQSVTVNGVEISELKYDAGTGKYTNAAGTATFEKFIPTNYDLLCNERVAWYATAGAGMMSDKFRTEFNKTVSAYKYQLLYLTKDENLAPEFYTVLLYSGGAVEPVRLKLTTEKVGDDRIKMKYKTVSGGATIFAPAKYPELLRTFFALPAPTLLPGQTEISFADYERAAKDPSYEGRTYVITIDNPTDPNPKTLTLTDASDPDYWFKLVVAQTNAQ